jgi:uncharacterized protein (TIGR00251 family)
MKLVETKDGTIVEVFVKPNQPKFKVTLESEEVIVSSTQEPVKNKVNKEIIKELSKLFRSQVELASGAASKEKKFMVEALSKTEVERILRESQRDRLRQKP